MGCAQLTTAAYLGAANRFPDKCDKDPEGTRALNVTATKSLASLCAARDILLIYISTDYVFPGKPGDAPYQSDATPQPTNLYGQTKLDGERAVTRVFEKENKPGLGVVLRVPVLYGDAEVPAESAVNVLMDSVWKAQEPDVKIKMDHWALRYPTNTEDVGRVCHGIWLPVPNDFSQNLLTSLKMWPRNISLPKTAPCCRRSSSSPLKTNSRNTRFARLLARSWAYQSRLSNLTPKGMIRMLQFNGPMIVI